MKRRRKDPLRGNVGVKADRSRGLRLLPYAIRENLPILGSQRTLGGKAKALARWFTVDGSCTWYITEGSARRTPDGKAVDYLLYGLVVGRGGQFDYFWLSDLVMHRSPNGLPIERDLRWRPKMLEQIAPELFEAQEKEPED